MSKKSIHNDHSAQQDAWIHGAVQTILLLNSRLNVFHIQSHVLNQAVVLTGAVHSEIDKWLSKQLLKGIKEIKTITNNIEVVAPNSSTVDTKMVAKRQAFLRNYNDTVTTAHIKSELLWNKSISGTEIEVSTMAGIVTLSGQVDYVANKALAELITLKSANVEGVQNKISVS